MGADSRKTTRFVAILLIVTLIITSHSSLGHAQDLVRWNQAFADKIDSLTFTAAGSVIIGSKAGIAAVATETGERLWSRDDVTRLAFAETGSSALAWTRDGGNVVIDLETGRDRWTAGALPFVKIIDWRFISAQDTLLVAGETRESPHSLIAVEFESGKLRWQQDGLFGDSPELARRARNIKYGELFANDRDLLLDPSYGGLMRLDPASGKLLWRASDRSLKPTGFLSTGISPIQIAGDRIFVATGRSLVILDATTGRLVAKRNKTFPTSIVQMAPTPKGLLVRGAYNLTGAIQRHSWKSYLALVDTTTGATIWSTEKQRSTFDVRSAFYVTEDGVLAALKDGLALFDLATGNPIRIARFQPFRDGDGPCCIEIYEDGRLLVTSRETMRLVDWSGKIHFDTYFKAPGVSGWARFALAAAYGMSGYAVRPLLQSSLISALSRQRASTDAARFRYTLAEVIDNAGRVRSALIRLDKMTGHEAGRVSFSDRMPTYVFDPATDVVLVATEQSLTGMTFPPPSNAPARRD
jgi:outer membrane protein assembly factor BamB